jgi:hypothetical protein
MLQLDIDGLTLPPVAVAHDAQLQLDIAKPAESPSDAVLQLDMLQLDIE